MVALGKPSEHEAGQWYFQRYVSHLPSAGEIVLFDRSWCNRRGVEQVDGLCHARKQVGAFLKAAPVFEKLLTDDGAAAIQVLAVLRPGEAGRNAFAESPRRPAQGLEALAGR